MPAGFYAPPLLPVGVSYAFRSSPYQAHQPPYGLLTADLDLPAAPVSGGLLDPVNADRLLDEEALEAARAKAGPLPDSLRGIAPGPEGGLFGMAVQEFWPEEADRTGSRSTVRPVGAGFSPPVVSPLAYRPPQVGGHAGWPGGSLLRAVADRSDARPLSAGLGPDEAQANRAWLDRYFSPDPAENRPRAAIIDMPRGPYLALRPGSTEPWTIDAVEPPRFTPERAKQWGVPEVRSPGAPEGSELAPSAQHLPKPGEGQLVVIRYPNGREFYAKNNETGEILRVDGGKMVVLTADEAEALGLQDWMPYTRPAERPQPVIPSAPEPTPRPSKRRDALLRALEQLIEIVPWLADEFYQSPAEELCREPEYARE